MGSDEESFWGVDNVLNNDSYVKIASVLFSRRTHTCVCTHTFFVFKEQDDKHIIIM